MLIDDYCGSLGCWCGDSPALPCTESAIAGVDCGASYSSTTTTTGGGGCWLSTACVRAQDLADDCDELQTLRAFRDRYVAHRPDGAAVLREYYETAPAIVTAIDAGEDPPRVWRWLYRNLVQRSVRLIRAGRDDAAFAAYQRVVRRLQSRYDCEPQIRSLASVASELSGYAYHATSATVAAVTCFYNPQRSRRRIANYAAFAAQFPRCGLPLYCLECSASSQWDLGLAWRLRLRSDCWFWAKENLLNLAIDRLPDRFTHVLWIDADALLLADDYADRLTEALAKHTVVQGAALCAHVDRDGWLGAPQIGLAAHNALVRRPCALPNNGWPGLAWAAPRQLLADVGGLYERAITGSGDTIWTLAIYGQRNAPGPAHWWPPAYLADVLAYVDRVAPHVRSVGYVPATAVHLYHGEREHRQYLSRHRILWEAHYDPHVHVERTADGTLRLTDSAPLALRNGLRQYLLSRREDD